MTPENIRRFLVYKDKKGKTQVHATECEHLGSHGLKKCGCPRRLAWGTVESTVGQVRALLQKLGRGDSWDEARGQGNPAYAQSVSDYLKVTKQEMSAAHVTPKQAKPLFLGKLEKVCDFLGREFACDALGTQEKFICLRDRAFLSLQFCAGDRAGDLCKMVAQEVKRLPEQGGLLVKHTQGKTTSVTDPKAFVVRRCANSTVCPVTNLEVYVQEAGRMGVDLTVGFLFRKASGKGRVLDLPITYDVAYDRLKHYLVTLGIYEGETPHSVRGGCAVTMRLTGAAQGIEDLQRHVGWRSGAMPVRYSRAGQAHNMDTSKRLQGAIDGHSVVTAHEAEGLYAGETYEHLPLAFS